MEPSQDNPYAPPQADLGGPGGSGDDPGLLRPVPYEDPEMHPTLWLRFKETVVQALKEHVGFLVRVPLGEGYARPWQFLMLAYLPSLAIVLLAAGLFAALGIASGELAGKAGALSGGVLLGLLAGGLVLSPLLVFLGMFVGGAFDHACLWLWGGTRNGVGMDQTIRADGYALGVFSLVQFPLQLLGLIPFVGVLFSLVNMGVGMAFLVFKGLALARMHRTDGWRGVCASLTPFLLLCCCGLIAALVIPALLVARTF